MVLDRLDIMEKRYDEITELLSNPDVASDVSKLTSLSKEQSSLQKPVELYREYKDLQAGLAELKEMEKSGDAEMAAMAREELEQAYKRIEEIE